MTTNTITPDVSYLENGVTLTHPVPFKFRLAADLLVERVAPASGTSVPLVLNLDYSVAGAGNPAGGSITKVSGGSAATQIRIRRRTKREQPMNYAANDTFPAESHEDALDRSIMIDQEQDELLGDLFGRGLLVPPGDEGITLPAPTARADTVFGFNGVGRALLMSASALALFVAPYIPRGPRGDPGGNAMAVGRFSDLTDIAVPAGFDRIFTTGAVQRGKGAAAYKRLDAAPSATEQAQGLGYWLRQDRSGAWFKLDEVFPTAFMMGAIGNTTVDSYGAFVSGTDDWAPLQALIHFILYADGGATGLCEPARFYSSKELDFGYGVGAYKGGELMGCGPSYRGVTAGTSIYFGPAAKMGVAVQGARGVRISALSLIGPNYGYLAVRFPGQPTTLLAGDNTDWRTWIDPAASYASTFNSRYAPCAAVVIDPRTGTKPTGGYATKAYPAWLGAVSEYGKLNSSDVQIRNVFAAGFASGLIVAPCDASSQAEYIQFADSYVEFSIYETSVGSSQCRSLGRKNIKSGFVHTGLTNKRHGQCIGRLHGEHSNNECFAGIQLIDINTGQSGPLTISNQYLESMYRIGSVGGGAANTNPVTLDGWHWNLSFGELAQQKIGLPLTVLTNGGTPVILRNTKFEGGRSRVLVLGGSPSLYKIEGTTHQASGDDAASSMAEYAAENFLAGFGFTDLSVTNFCREFNVTHNLRRNLDTGATTIGGEQIPDASVSSRSFGLCAWTRGVIPRSARHRRYEHNLSLWAGYGPTAAVTLTGRTLTHTLSATYSLADVKNVFGIRPGGVIRTAEGVYAAITAETGGSPNTITAYLFNGIKGAAGSEVYAGNGYADSDAFGTPIDPLPFSSNTGTWYFGLSTGFAPAVPTIGDFASGSATVSNVGTAGGSSSHLGTEIKVDDWLVLDPSFDATVGRDKSRIAAAVSGTPTLTIGGNAARSAPGKLLAVLARTDIPNKA